MPRDGASTRTGIMDAAEAFILQQGFAATSIEQVVERAGITKGAFFYHFKSKGDLAHALVERYAALEADLLERTLDRAEKLSREPLQQALIVVALFQEDAAQLTEPYPGCLFASYCYEAQLFDDEVLRIIRSSMQQWRERFGAKLAAVMESRPPRLPATADDLADMLQVIFEGAFILSKTFKDPRIVSAQLGQYRDYLELLFAPPA